MKYNAEPIVLRRKSACNTCPKKCGDFLQQKVPFENVQFVCPLNRWPRIILQVYEQSENRVHSVSAGVTPTHPFMHDTLPHRRKGLVSPGDLLEHLIHQVTGAIPGNCSCNNRKNQMNDWGWWGCWRRRKEITGWLIEEAEKRGRVLPQKNAIGLFRVAFRELISKMKTI